MVLVGAVMRTLALLIAMLAGTHAFAGGPAVVDGIPLPQPDCGFGCYYTPGQYPLEREYMRTMAQHGMNTLAPQARSLPGRRATSAAGDIARELNNAAVTGLLDPRFPVVCYSVGPEDVVATLNLRRPELQWPELVVQSIDEPNQTQERTLREYQAAAHKCGLRIGTAVAGYNCTGYKQQLPWCAPADVGKDVPEIGSLLDLWIILVGTLTPDVYAAAKRQGAEVGAYLAYPSSPLLDRWTFGLWAWRAKPRICLLWAALNKQDSWDYSRIHEISATRFDDSGLDGAADGIIDYRVLMAVRDLHTQEGDNYLHRIERRTSLGWWPRGYVRDNQHLERPTVSMDAVRYEGLRLLKAR